MDIRELEYILTVHEEGGITRAAEKLFITQPALSRYVKAVEARIGTPIFDRSVTPIGLTPAGREYTEMARSVINTYNDFEHRVSDINDLKTGTLRLGIPSTRAMYYMPLILPSFYKNYPGIDLKTVEDTSVNLEKQILRGKLDLIFLSGPCEVPELECVEIAREQLYFAAPQGYFPETADSFFSILSELHNREHVYIILHKGQRLRQKSDDIMARYELKVGKTIETRMTETAIKLCSEGIGFTFTGDLPKAYIQSSNPPAYYKLGEEFASPAVIAYRKEGYLSNAARVFIKHVKQQFAQ